jgi:hypothetical protein
MTYGWNGKIRCKLKFAALILFVIFISRIRETAPQRPLISLRTCIYIFTCTPQKLSKTMQLCLRASVVLFIAVKVNQINFFTTPPPPPRPINCWISGMTWWWVYNQHSRNCTWLYPSTPPPSYGLYACENVENY